MQVVTQEFVKNKKVLLRYDIDVALKQGERGKGKGESQIAEDFKLRAGLPTLKLCLENASKVIVIGHLGRPARNASHSDAGGPARHALQGVAGGPEGKVVEELRVAPVVEWFKNHNLRSYIESGKLVVLENLRFDPREEACDPGYAKELASLGDVYINEAFSSYHSAVSTTIVPILLPHACGLHFAEEVRVLGGVRDNPKKPFVAIMGGAKVADKLPVISVLAGKADAVLVGGKLIAEIKEQNLSLPKNVMVGMLNKDGFDIAPETVSAWSDLIRRSRMIVWNGPVGKIESQESRVKSQESEENLGSATGSYEIARMVLGSEAEVIIGGGDTVAFLGSIGMLEKFEEKGLPAGRQGFVSVGGGAMLNFLADGTLPTIQVLD